MRGTVSGHEPGRLGAEEQRRGAGALTVEREVVRQMMTTDLQQPRRPLRGRAEEGDVEVAGTPSEASLVDRRQHVIRQSHLVHHRQTAGRQSSGEQPSRGGALGRVEIAQTNAGSRHELDGEVRPDDGSRAREWVLERRPQAVRQRVPKGCRRGHDRRDIAAASSGIAAGRGFGGLPGWRDGRQRRFRRNGGARIVPTVEQRETENAARRAVARVSESLNAESTDVAHALTILDTSLLNSRAGG